MAGSMMIRLRTTDGADCVWRDPETGAAGRGTLSAAGEAASGRRAHLVVPGSDVLLTRVAVPAGQRARALAAIPWALEDRLADDVETLHFALGRQHEDGQWSVAVVARAKMDHWLALCAQAGLHPASIRPAPLALPLPAAEEWIAHEDGAGLAVRTGDDTGFACEPDMLAIVATTRPAPQRIRRLGAGTAEWPPALAPLLGEVEPLAEPAAAWTLDGDGIELLQGPYSRRERAGRQLRRWRVPAAIAAALVVAFGIHLGFDYAALGAREAALRGQMQALFRQTFPDVQRVSDPRAQMAARLRSLRGGGGGGADFADLLARTGEALAQGGEARLAGLTWRGTTLELEIEADSLQALDRVQRGLASAGLAAELEGAERGEAGIEGRITVSEGGP